MKDKLIDLKDKYSVKINASTKLAELDLNFLELFGKNGLITSLPKNFSSLSKDELREIGPLFNSIKKDLEDLINQKRTSVKESEYKKLEAENLNLEETEIKKRAGSFHPLTKLEAEIVEIFSKLGFQRYDGPQIDSDYNNFEVLNIPPEHPARDLWDTLYINTNLLLRTHTSNSQIRIMKDFKPPIRLMVIGRCFRYENLDARHEHTFEQFELVYIDKGLSMANLQYLSEQFFKEIFGSDIKARLKPKYYPFVEPGAGVDGLCIFCKGKARLPDGKSCHVCGGIGWLELAGAGMIHPQVLKNGGIDPNEYSGIAWGFGPMRMAMIKYGINDIRTFNSGDLKKLKEITKQ